MELEDKFVSAVMVLRSLEQKAPLITFTFGSTAIILEVGMSKIILTTMVIELGIRSVPNKYEIWKESDTNAALKASVVPWKQKIIVAIAMLVENDMV